ncbi:transposase [Crenobacter sp. SG2303]|uniref:Transposase n=1 Tax=Crenobacter oryzisoli TaxID=3056844 RepID=A0ABT7XNV2_9NEIS|nr:transposase [Crenobacter sp. SG2303]MDN0075482.1 transposase [Crenobacter sp. SG2303]
MKCSPKKCWTIPPIVAGICDVFEAELVAFDGENDLMHLLVNYPPKTSTSALLNSRMIRKKNNSSIHKKL